MLPQSIWLVLLTSLTQPYTSTIKRRSCLLWNRFQPLISRNLSQGTTLLLSKTTQTGKTIMKLDSISTMRGSSISNSNSRSLSKTSRLTSFSPERATTFGTSGSQLWSKIRYRESRTNSWGSRRLCLKMSYPIKVELWRIKMSTTSNRITWTCSQNYQSVKMIAINMNNLITREAATGQYKQIIGKIMQIHMTIASPIESYRRKQHMPKVSTQAATSPLEASNLDWFQPRPIRMLEEGTITNLSQWSETR